MARLVIGVDVAGVQDVERLSVGISKAEKALQSWVNTSSKASSSSLVTAVTVLDGTFAHLGTTAKEVSAKLDAFFKGPKSSNTAAIFGEVEAVKLLESSYKKLAAAHGKQRVMEMPGAQRIKEATKAIEENIVAYEKLRSAGKISGKYSKSNNYLYEQKLYEARAALGSGANQAAILAEEKLAAARAALGSGANQAAILAEGKLAAARAALSQGTRLAKVREEAYLYNSTTGALRSYYRMLLLLDPALARLGVGWMEAAAASNAFHAALRGASGAIGTLWLSYGQMLPLIAGFAAVASTIKTVKLGSEFDYMTRSIQKLSGDSYQGAEALTAIQQSLLGMKGLINTPDELAKGMLEFARAGIPAAQAAKELSEVSKFSFLGEMDMGKTVETVVGLMTAFNNLNATAGLNQMAVVADKTSVSLGQMTDAFKNTTSLGTVMGMEFKDIALSLGVLGQSGVRGATAGAALTTMMYKLAAPTASAQKEMKALGVSFDVFDKATGKIKSVTQIASELAKATNALNPKQVSMLFESMVGLRGVKSLGALVDMAKSGSEQFKELQKAVEGVANLQPGDQNTYLSKYFDVVSQSGKVQLGILKADIDKLFTANYDNSSVVNALKELDKLINNPEAAKILSSVTSLLINAITVVATAVTTYPDIFEYGFLGLLLYGKVGAQVGVFVGAVAETLKRVDSMMNDLAAKSGLAKKKTADELSADVNPFKALFAVFSKETKTAKEGVDGLGSSLDKLSNTKLNISGASEQIEAMSKLESFMQGLENQVKDLGKSKIELIEEERIAKIGELKIHLAGAKMSQSEFNDELTRGTDLINRAFDAKLVDNIKKDINSAKSEWESYAITAIAATDRAMQAAIQSVNATKNSLVEIVQMAASSSAAAANAAMAEAAKGQKNMLMSAYEAAQAGKKSFLQSLVGGLTGDSATDDKTSAVLSAFLKQNDLMKAQGDFKDLPRSQQIVSTERSAIVKRTEEAAAAIPVLKQYMLTQEQADLTAAGKKSSSYKGTIFDASKLTGAPKEVMDMVNTITDSTSTAIHSNYGPELKKALESENKKAVGEANKAMRAELRQTKAELALASNDVHKTNALDKDWLKDYEKYSNKLYSIQEDAQTLGMNEYQKDLYNLTAEYDRAYKALDWYSTALDTNQQRIDETTGKLKQYEQALSDIKGNLEDVSLLSDPEKKSTALGLTNEIDKLKDNLSKLQDARVKLGEMAEKYPVISRDDYERLKKAEATTKALSDAYSQLGGVTKELVAVQAQLIQSQYELNKELMGEDIAGRIRDIAHEELVLKDVSSSAFDGMIVGLRKFAREAKTTAQVFSDAMVDALNTVNDKAVDSLLEGTDDWKKTFQDLSKSTLKDLTKTTVTGPLAGWLGDKFNLPSLESLAGGKNASTINVASAGAVYINGKGIGETGPRLFSTKGDKSSELFGGDTGAFDSYFNSDPYSWDSNMKSTGSFWDDYMQEGVDKSSDFWDSMYSVGDNSSVDYWGSMYDSGLGTGDDWWGDFFDGSTSESDSWWGDFFDTASGFLGSLFDGVGSMFSGGGSGGILSSLFHTGGIVGSGEGGVRSIGIPNLSSLPRFHTGLMPDEFLSVLQKGEGVFTRGQMQALGMMTSNQRNASNTTNNNSSSLSISVPVSVEGGSKKLTSELQRGIERAVKQIIRENV